MRTNTNGYKSEAEAAGVDFDALNRQCRDTYTEIRESLRSTMSKWRLGTYCLDGVCERVPEAAHYLAAYRVICSNWRKERGLVGMPAKTHFSGDALIGFNLMQGMRKAALSHEAEFRRRNPASRPAPQRVEPTPRNVLKRIGDKTVEERFLDQISERGYMPNDETAACLMGCVFPSINKLRERFSAEYKFTLQPDTSWLVEKVDPNRARLEELRDALDAIKAEIDKLSGKAA